MLNDALCRLQTTNWLLTIVKCSTGRTITEAIINKIYCSKSGKVGEQHGKYVVVSRRTPDADPEDFSHRLKISSSLFPRPSQSTKARKLFNPDRDPIPMRRTTDPEPISGSTSIQSLPEIYYVLASSTSSYAAPISSSTFTLSSTTDGSSTSSYLFDIRPNQDRAKNYGDRNGDKSKSPAQSCSSIQPTTHFQPNWSLLYSYFRGCSWCGGFDHAEWCEIRFGGPCVQLFFLNIAHEAVTVEVKGKEALKKSSAFDSKLNYTPEEVEVLILPFSRFFKFQGVRKPRRCR